MLASHGAALWHRAKIEPAWGENRSHLDAEYTLYYILLQRGFSRLDFLDSHPIFDGNDPPSPDFVYLVVIAWSSNASDRLHTGVRTVLRPSRLKEL